MKNSKTFMELFNLEISTIKEKISFDDNKKNMIINFTEQREREVKTPFQKVIVTTIVSFLIGLSIIFLLLNNNVYDDEISGIFITAFILYIVPGLFIYFKKNSIIGSAVINFGMVVLTIATISFIFDSGDLYILFAFFLYIMLVAGIYFLENISMKIFFSILFYISFVFLFIELNDNVFFLDDNNLFIFVFYILTIINSLLHFVSYKMLNKEEYLKGLNINYYYLYRYSKCFCLFTGFLSFFIVTFFKNEDFPQLFFINNIIFFLAISGFLFFSIKKKNSILKNYSMFFWFAYIFYKYYDLCWKLFQKSIFFIILGIMLFITATVIAKKNEVYK